MDVFFVISGFVVSASILGQNQATFSGFYSNFLSRRVKRLMPALIACVATTGVVVFLIDPFPRHSILTGISALFGVANITLFNFELDYFSPSSKFNAFTHMWSLGVEEQFYVVFPIIVWLTIFGKARRPPNIYPASIVLMSLLSFLFFLWLYDVNQVAAYYLMPTRFWELGTGALIYQATNRFDSTRIHRILALASPCALVALVLCFFVPQGYATLSTPVAVGLTGLLLFNSSHNISWRMLSLPPAVYVGKISYSLYLWHWPVVALGPLLLSASWRISGIYVVTMGIAAIFSYQFIERPLRAANWSRSKPLDIAMAFTCSFVLGLSAFFALNSEDSPVGQDAVVLHPEAFLPLLDSGLPYGNTCAVDDRRPLTPQTFERCTIPPVPGSGMPMIWAIGDSHAGHLQGLLYELHQAKGFGVHLVETPGHSFPASNGIEYAPRQMLFNEVLDNLKPGDIVLIARLYLARTNPTTPQGNISEWSDRVSGLAKELEKRGVSLVLAGPPPMFNFTDVRECDIDERKNCAVARADIAPAIDAVMKQLTRLRNANKNILIFDIFAQVCPPVLQFCYPDDGISFLYRDRDHFNSLGSKRLAESFVNLLRSKNKATPPPKPTRPSHTSCRFTGSAAFEPGSRHPLEIPGLRSDCAIHDASR